MYCIYCGRLLDGNYCTHCNVLFTKNRVFTITSNRCVDYEKFYCFHCGKPVYVIFDNRPEEIAGICAHCHKPTRLDRKEKGDAILI